MDRHFVEAVASAVMRRLSESSSRPYSADRDIVDVLASAIATRLNRPVASSAGSGLASKRSERFRFASRVAARTASGIAARLASQVSKRLDERLTQKMVSAVAHRIDDRQISRMASAVAARVSSRRTGPLEEGFEGSGVRTRDVSVDKQEGE